MKKSIWLILAIFAIVSIAVLWRLVPSQENKNDDEPVVNRQPITTTNSQFTNSVTKDGATKKVEANKSPEEAIFDPYKNEALKAELKRVSDSYAETIKYPVDSQPIYNPQDAREFEEFEQAEVDLPFPDGEDDANPIRISAATNTFQYFDGEPIIVRVQISGVPAETFVQVNGVLSGTNGDLPVEGVFEPSDRSLSEFTAVFDSKLAPPNLLTPEMLVKLNVTVGDRPLFTTVGFRYAVASAQIVAVQQVRPQGPNLIIPLQMNVFQNGYYFVNGVLEDAQTGQPLLQLQAEQRLAQGNAIINLSAHISALRRQGSEGPYVLRSLQTYRGAEVGERFDAPASSSQSRFAVQGFPFSAYEDEEYLDEQAQERLEFLRGLGAVDEEAAREQQETESESLDQNL